MSVQPDIIWNEQCLGIRIGEQVCIYLKKHNAEYQRLQKKILELIEKYPVIETFMEAAQSISLTADEHQALHQYFQLENGKEMIEEEYQIPLNKFIKEYSTGMKAKLNLIIALTHQAEFLMLDVK